ncbi:LexA family protein [Dubosiella newyorkensis]|uniref:LexA family protein n=1 Tax=Dubosiella newyorkensis TaxID=1862672 RepID=UPI003F67862B
MAKIYENIKNLRKKKGWSQTELAKRAGYTDRTSIAKIENGNVDLPQSRIAKFAEVFGVTESELMGLDKINENLNIKNLIPFEVKEIPLLGKIACGEPIFADEERGRYTLVSGVNADFALEAQGDSMIGDRIYNGDIVFCRNQPTVENGEIAVVIIKDEATLKHFFYYPDRGLVILKASNPAYEDLIYMDDEMADIRILGKAVAVEFGI